VRKFRATLKRTTVEHMAIDITARDFAHATELAERKTHTKSVRGVTVASPYDESDSEVSETVSIVREVGGNN
jgi:hypothetical protein